MININACIHTFSREAKEICIHHTTMEESACQHAYITYNRIKQLFQNLTPPIYQCLMAFHQGTSRMVKLSHLRINCPASRMDEGRRGARNLSRHYTETLSETGSTATTTVSPSLSSTNGRTGIVSIRITVVVSWPWSG